MILQGDTPAALSLTAFTSSPSLHLHLYIKLVNLSLPTLSVAQGSDLRENKTSISKICRDSE